MAINVAVVFEIFLPYIRARLCACAELMNVVGVEISPESRIYPWSQAGGQEDFVKYTLFEKAQPLEKIIQDTEGRLREVLDHCEPDVVAICGWSAQHALAALRWCVSRQVPAVLMSDSTIGDATRHRWKEAVKARLVGLYGAALVAGSRQVAYVERLGMPRARIFTGYDVVDNGHFAGGADASRRDAAALRHKLGLPAHYFLASGRFIEVKNLPRLVEAYSRYRERSGKEGWDLLILGDGGLRGVIEDRVRELGVARHVHLPGFKQYEELPAYYGLAGAFILASTADTWGLVVNEAMAAGLPVLVSERCGCAPDLVEEGVNGFTFDPLDVAAIAERMAFVASERCDREAMGRASRRIIARWTPRIFAEGLMKAVETARLTGPPPAGPLDRLLIEALLRHRRASSA